ncbi:hypothetical protein N037_22045 [Enterobacter sp. EGD-HP1]|nr:hypothetical protein N037_22045 [Enterobacter sp. EGD-HP1]
MLAMQNAAGAQPVGRLLRLHAIAGMAYWDLSTMWFTGHKSLFALWPLPEKIPAMERAGGRE